MSRRYTLGRVFLPAALAVAAAMPVVPAIAQLSSRPAAAWIERLESPDRVKGLKIPEIVAALGLKPGQAVADIGAGAGVFDWPLAKAVGPKGTVYAVEIDKGFLTHIDMRAKEQQVTNVTTVLGEFDDPKLPAQVDLALLHDVLHHVEHREVYVKALASYVKPTGRIAVIELDATKPGSSHRDDPALQVSREQAKAWMAAAGLDKADEIQMFDDKWFVIYSKSNAH